MNGTNNKSVYRNKKKTVIFKHVWTRTNDKNLVYEDETTDSLGSLYEEY